MDEPLEGPRYTVESDADEVRVTLPPARSWQVILFLSVWMIGWAFGEASAAAQVFGWEWIGLPRYSVHRATAIPGFLVVWLAGWSVGGVVVFTTLMWQLAGREIITVNRQRLTRRIEMFRLGSNHSYTMSEVRNLRSTVYINDRFTQRRVLFHWMGTAGYGSIAFDYGARTIRFAPGIDEAEAKMLVAELSRRL